MHDYDEALDPDSRVLTLILCAPVVVASWINLFAFTDKRCDRYTPQGWIQGPSPLSASGVGGSLAGT